MHGEYVATTMMIGLAKIIPIILFAAAGYFVFIKLPFWVFLKVLRASKGLPEYQMPEFQLNDQTYKPDYNVGNYEAFLRKQKRAQEAEERARNENVLNFQSFERSSDEQPPMSEAERKERAELNERRKKYAEELRAKVEEQNRAREEMKKKKEKEKQEREARERYARQEREQEERRKQYSSNVRSDLVNAENLFNFQTGQNFSQAELKKRYRELLKANHPDMVTGSDMEAKKIAERKTQQIISAYEQLKYRAS